MTYQLKNKIIELEEQYEFATEWLESSLRYPEMREDADETQRVINRLQADINQLEYLILKGTDHELSTKESN